MRDKEKKKKIFDLMNTNLSLVFDTVYEDEKIDTGGYAMCPLCNKAYNIDCLENDYEGVRWTLEHVPPNSVGGKANILTCSYCNSTHGSKIDSELHKRIAHNEFLKGENGELKRVQMKFTDFSVNGTWKIENGSVQYQIGLNNNPKNINQIREVFNKGEKTELKVKLPSLNNRKAALSMLRAGLLYLFSKLGYAIFLDNSYIESIKKQLDNPEEELLNHLGVFSFKNKPKNYAPLNLCKFPSGTTCYAIAFEIGSKKSKSKEFILILIPGRSRHGKAFYEEIGGLNSGEIKMKELDASYLFEDKKKSLTPFIMWNNIDAFWN